MKFEFWSVRSFMEDCVTWELIGIRSTNTEINLFILIDCLKFGYIKPKAWKKELGRKTCCKVVTRISKSPYSRFSHSQQNHHYIQRKQSNNAIFNLNGKCICKRTSKFFYLILMGRRRKKDAQLIFLRFKETLLNVYRLGPTFHPMSPLPIVKLLMGIVYMLENILSDFPSLVGDLCIIV